MWNLTKDWCCAQWSLLKLGVLEGVNLQAFCEQIFFGFALGSGQQQLEEEREFFAWFLRGKMMKETNGKPPYTRAYL